MISKGLFISKIPCFCFFRLKLQFLICLCWEQIWWNEKDFFFFFGPCKSSSCSCAFFYWWIVFRKYMQNIKCNIFSYLLGYRTYGFIWFIRIASHFVWSHWEVKYCQFTKLFMAVWGILFDTLFLIWKIAHHTNHSNSHFSIELKTS